jgi:nicotinamide mononucleotide transporter
MAYLLLAIRQSVWCWPAAVVSTSLYLFIMYGAGLYMESALQAFYIAIAIYGWQQWSAGGGAAEPAELRGPVSPPETATASANQAGRSLRVSTWPPRRHLLVVGLVIIASAVSGALLSRYTDAALPYADSFTTWGALIATWMVARKILENWLYWFVIDSVSVYLYLTRELYLTAALFIVYLVLIVVGYREWRRSMQS